MLKVSGLLAAFFLLSGCVTEEKKQQIYAAQKPTSQLIKSAALEYAKKSFFDPYSIRDASISDAFTPPDGSKIGVCLRLNAKNRMGAYTGIKTTSLIIENNVVVQSADEDPACEDPRVNYHPFSELEAL